MRRAARTDANQAEIVKALRRIGAAVEVIGKPLDLLVAFRGRTFLMDCKVRRPPSEGGSHGKTKEQQEFIARWPGEYHFPHSAEEAIAQAVGKEAMR